MSIKGQAMSARTMKKANAMNNRLLCIASAAAALLLLLGSAHAAAPGVKGSTFTLTAKPDYIVQPDGQAVYSWGYACSAATGSAAPSTIAPPVTGVCGGEIGRAH